MTQKNAKTKMQNDQKKNILIIEDEVHIANAERLILESEFNVHVAMDGKEGLTKALELQPHVIILDIMLPSMNGFDICKKLREHKHMNATKIVMVTAKDQDKDELAGMNLGADDYIMKPFEADELIHVVNQVLRG
jgi:DNA-binding response OmpR family regulator